MKNRSVADQIAKARASGNPFQISVYRRRVNMFGSVMENTEQRIGQYMSAGEIVAAISGNLGVEIQRTKLVTDVRIHKKNKLFGAQYKVRIRTQNGPTLYYRYDVSITYC